MRPTRMPCQDVAERAIVDDVGPGAMPLNDLARAIEVAALAQPYIGVPRDVVERRMQRGQLVGGPQARVPLYVPYADFFQYQAGPGRLAERA